MKTKVIELRATEAAEKLTQYTREYLRSADVCKIFSISNSTLKWLRGTGQIPYYVLGNTFLYRKEDIEAALRPGSILESKELKTTPNEYPPWQNKDYHTIRQKQTVSKTSKSNA